MCAKRSKRNDLFDMIRFLHAEGETIHKKRRAAYDEKMSGQYGNILVRCPVCGSLSLVPNTGRKRWKCPCTPKQSRFVREDALPDQKHLTLERGVTVFTGQKDPVLSECRLLEHVTIKGYERIAESAFEDCRHLRTVQLCDGIIQIGDDAFSCCSALEQIDLPGSLVEIGDGAFNSCTALKKISLPSNLTKIGDYAFYDCTALEQIDLPGSLIEIGDSAFDHCTALEQIDLPGSLARIGRNAFEYSGLRKIVLLDRLQQLGDGAFAQCKHLDKAEIPPKLLEGLWLDSIFDRTPFYKSHYERVHRFLPDGSVEMRASLREFVRLAARWPQPISLFCAGSLFCEDDPMLFEPAGPEERKQMEESFQKLVALGLYGSSVPAWRFCGCSNLKRLILSRRLERIGEGAFAHCTALEELVIPDSVTHIEPKAFLGCSSLRRVRMAELLLKTLDGSAFEDTPFWQDPGLRKQACRRSDALLVFLGGGAGNTAVALCKRMNSRQDLLLLEPSLEALYHHSADCTMAISDMPGPEVEKPRLYEIQTGKKLIKGWGCGAGGDPQRGIQALREAKDEVYALLRQYRLVIVVTNLVGGTGGSVPLLAQWLREMEISYTIIAGTPFAFEGKWKMGIAQSALNELRDSPVIEVPYEEMSRRTKNEGTKVTLKSAFDLADQEVCQRLEQLLVQHGLQ